jgi:hypothetical protein
MSSSAPRRLPNFQLPVLFSTGTFRGVWCAKTCDRLFFTNDWDRWGANWWRILSIPKDRALKKRFLREMEKFCWNSRFKTKIGTFPAKIDVENS